jgi:glycosyltransferase involved in cell wall biosynthesis
LVWKQKVEGVKKLIEAFTCIEKEYPNAILLIVGDGNYRRELEILCERKNLKEKVIFCGFVENTFVPLTLTDIYAHISLQEGLPIALLEAMSCGKPVVAANIGGIPELITNKKTGILVEPVPEKIAKEIIDLLKNKDEMNRLGEAAKKHVEDKFSWDRTVDEYLELYNSGVP